MLVFLGGGGSGLSALVNIFYDIGFKDILVIDKTESEITEKLKNKGIKTIIGEGVYNFQPEDIIIYSDAVINSQDFKNAKNNKKFSYFEFIGEISKRFQTISIAGTHGKTSTTAIAISTAKKLNFKDIALGIVGGFIKELNNQNYFINTSLKPEIKTVFEKILSPKGSRPTNLFKKYYFIVEADEFNRHFLLLDNYISLITKVDHDHKDIYPTEKEYLDAFKLFITKTRKKTLTTDKNFIKKIDNLANQVILVNKSNFINFEYIFGDHMKQNASLVLELFLELGFNKETVLKAISSFKGVRRRQEYLGKIGKVDVYTDYAHHPAEISSTYQAFKKNFPNKKIIGVFQPHQVFRLISYKKDFENVLKEFDKIYIYDIYSVREEKLLEKLTGKKLPIKEQKKIIGNQIAKNVNGQYIENFNDLIKILEKENNGIALVMTAGDLDYKLRKLLEK